MAVRVYSVRRIRSYFRRPVTEIVEDISHPLQKVNIKGDDPFQHDWDWPFYASSMAGALADLVRKNPELMTKGSINSIHDAMKSAMREYYQPNKQIKDRAGIKMANNVKRWNSGRLVVWNNTLKYNFVTSLLPKN